MNKKTDEILNLIASLKKEDRDYLNEYLANAPISILEQFDISYMKGGTTFIFEGEETQKVFILVEGWVKAIDQYKDGVSFEYMWFKPVKVFGVMEMLLGVEHYQTTLTTATDSRFLVIPKRAFEKWISQDVRTLRLETRTMGTYLLTQAKMARAFLFLEGKQRVMLFIASTFDLYRGVVMVKLSRQSIADNTGLSIRTVNRAIKELTEEGLICCQGMKILLDEKQQERLKRKIKELWQGQDIWNRLL